ncbi:Hypothetical protein, putative [Bodo saltans]|uniref:Uncharacterized protein n=1 Tax=Bodo saltans TaxID=75058 RepID=A0A0S4IR08_BODSA|nr:Hypothetical protein, putative [Bodo saltans]|eukprot:CUF99546.1 Hypothetical protein, putative [Bodo saltans]
MSKKVAAKGAKEEEGPQAPVFDPSTFVALESSDGDCLLLDRNCARLSRLLKQVLQDPNPSNQIEYSVSTLTFPIAPELLAKQPVTAATSPDPSTSLEGGADSAAPNTLTYPLIKIHALNSEQLSHAVAFMHYKYRYDSEAEKKTSTVFGGSGAVPRGIDGLRWAAVAHILLL